MACHGCPAANDTPRPWGRCSPDAEASPGPRALHLLAVSDPVNGPCQRQMCKRLTVQESRHNLARGICHDEKGIIRPAYEAACRNSPASRRMQDRRYRMRVESVMREPQIACHARRAGRRNLTRQDPKTVPAPDLVGRDFQECPSRVNSGGRTEGEASWNVFLWRTKEPLEKVHRPSTSAFLSKPQPHLNRTGEVNQRIPSSGVEGNLHSLESIACAQSEQWHTRA